MRGRVALLVAYAAAATVHLVALAAGIDLLAVATKVVLVPLLLGWVLLTGRPAPRLLVVALVLAWLGDVALELPGDAAFVVGLLFFLGMQVCYVRGFARLGAIAALRRRPLIVAAYALAWVALCAWLLPSLGVLRWPMLGYSVVLAGVGVLAAGVSVRVGLGGLLFFVSDSLIAVGVADHDFTGRDVAVMATYALAQYLIASGWLARSCRPRVGGSAP